MKRVFAAAMMLLVILTSVEAYAEYDFRQANWGDTPEQVIAIEGTPIDRSSMPGTKGERLMYKTTAVGLDVYLHFEFNENNKLYSAGYLFYEEHSNEQEYVKDYEKFRDALTKKYGEPDVDAVIWNDQSMKEYYIKNGKSMGNAVCYGYCEYYTSYETNDTTITMLMTADNYEITSGVFYESKVIEAAEENYSSEI